MDNIDTLSDCSELSRNSESFPSNVSTLSELSEYQGEFLELRQLIYSESNLTESKRNGTAAVNIAPCYEKQITDLNTKLQYAMQQNEKFKNDMHNNEKKNDISRSEKIKKLLKQNQTLEANLSAANNQIQRLISIHNKKDDEGETALSTEKVLQLEKSNHELINQNYLLSTNLNQCNFQKDEIENEYKNLKYDFNELKLELTAKVNSVIELKKKIAQQHVQLQELSQNNVKISHSLDMVSNELQFVKKSEVWYKDELRQFQQEKSDLCERVWKNENVYAGQKEKIERLKVELSFLKCCNEKIHLAALKEKEAMLTQLEFVEREVKSQYSCSSVEATSNIESITKYYDSVVNDLTGEVVKMKTDFEYQQTCFEKVYKEKCDIAGKYLSVQICLKDKEHTILNLENNIKDLKEKLTSAIDIQSKSSAEMLSLKKNFVMLESEFDLKNEEKKNFEQSVNIVKEQFKIFLNKYVNQKNEVYQQNKEISQLQYEKQELCVDNNKKISELKKILETDGLEMEKFKQKVFYLEAVNENMNSENMRKAKTIEHLNCELMKIRSNFNKQMNSFCQHENASSNNESLDSHAPETTNLNLLRDFEDLFFLDALNVVDILKYICQMCKLSDDDNKHFVTDYECVPTANSQKFCIRFLVKRIHSHLQNIETEIASKTKDVIGCKKKLKTLKDSVMSRIANLTHRCKGLEIQNEEHAKTLKSLFDERYKNYPLSDEIQYLQTQLQVKTQEAKDKQKRYERNYRTLIRKVKEHMRGRNSAEKHSAHLQELYDTLVGDCNTLRLDLHLKNSAVEELQNRLEKSLVINEKLKSTLLKLEKDWSDARCCRQCVDFEMSKKRELELEKLLQNYDNCKSASTKDLKIKEEVIESLQKENQRLLSGISSKNAEYKNNTTTIEVYCQDNKISSAKLLDVETKLAHAKSSNDFIKAELIGVRDSALKTCPENEQLVDKHIHLAQEVKHLNSCLQMNSEEVNELQRPKQHSLNRWLEKEQNMQNLISSLKNQVHVFKNEIHIIKNEKKFLQRLCNDLKVALKTLANHNKALKDCLEKLYKDREENDNKSIILPNFPNPVKYDVVHINQLLKENQMSFQDKSFCDIRECFNTLMKEILFLQKQIAEKNVT